MQLRKNIKKLFLKQLGQKRLMKPGLDGKKINLGLISDFLPSNHLTPWHSTQCFGLFFNCPVADWWIAYGNLTKNSW